MSKHLANLLQDEQQTLDAGGVREDAVRDLERTVSAQRAFTDVLYTLLEASSEPPDEAAIIDILEFALHSVVHATSANDGALLVRDDATEELVFVLCHGDVPKDLLAWTRVPRGVGIAHWVAKNRCPAIVNDTGSDERFYRGIDEQHDFHTRTVLAAPVIYEGQLLGVTEVLNKGRNRLFSQSDQNRLVLFCYFAGKLLHHLSSAAQSGGETLS